MALKLALTHNNFNSLRQNALELSRDKKKAEANKRSAANKAKSGTDSEQPAEQSKKPSATKKSATASKSKSTKTTAVASATTTAKTETKDVVVPKRMASLNASAMLAAAYEAERHIDRVESKYTTNATVTDSDAPSTPKRLKDIKNEERDDKEVRANILQFTTFILGLLLSLLFGASVAPAYVDQYSITATIPNVFTSQILTKPIHSISILFNWK